MFNAAGTTLLNKAADLFMGSAKCTQLQNKIKENLYLAERLMLLRDYEVCINRDKRILFGDSSEGAAQRLFDGRGSIHKPNAGVTSGGSDARRMGRRGPVIMADYAYDDAPMTTPPAAAAPAAAPAAPMTTPPAAAAPVAAKRIGRRGPVTGPVMANFAYQGSDREPNHLFRLAVARAKAHHRP